MNSEPLKNLLENEIQLRKDLIQRFIEREFGGNRAAFGRSLELQDLPHRKTILRWASGEDCSLPKGAKRLLALAQALDVDPFLLLDIDLPILIESCRKASWNLSWGAIHKALSFLNDIFKLTEADWPPAYIAELYDGEWYTHNFLHHPRADGRNYFKPLLLEPDTFYDGDGNLTGPRDPQLWYFGFREVRVEDQTIFPVSFWRPYGIIYLYQNQLTLLHLSGMLHHQEITTKNGHFIAETFFGQGASEFRIASLHPFQARFPETDEIETLPVLRFDFPE